MRQNLRVKQLLMLATMASAAATLAACNTAHGFGQDMTDAGHAITNAVHGGSTTTGAPATTTAPAAGQ